MSDGEIRKADEIGRTHRWRDGGGLSARELITLVLVVLVGLFAVLNLEDVSIDVLAGSVTVPLIIVIVVCGFVGFVAGFVVARRRARRD
jgi:uncharacterized integral membrane protein